MAKHVYDVNDIGALSEKIKQMPDKADEAMAQAINKAATLAVRESVDRIAAETTLQEPYIRQNLKRVARASPNNLRAVVQARARATLTGRFRHAKTPTGVKLQVNRAGGYREIKRGWIARNLKNSGGVGVAMTFKDSIAQQEANMGKGKGATPGKLRRLAGTKDKASKSKRGMGGMDVLHSRSINQLFTDVREDIQPVVEKKLAAEFVADFKRKMNR